MWEEESRAASWTADGSEGGRASVEARFASKARIPANAMLKPIAAAIANANLFRNDRDQGLAGTRGGRKRLESRFEGRWQLGKISHVGQ